MLPQRRAQNATQPDSPPGLSSGACRDRNSDSRAVRDWAELRAEAGGGQGARLQLRTVLLLLLHAYPVPPCGQADFDTLDVSVMRTGLIVDRGRTGSVGRIGGVRGGVAQVVAAFGGVGDVAEAGGVVLVGAHVRVGRGPPAAAARRVLLVGVVAAVGSCGHRQGWRLLGFVQAAVTAAAVAAAARAGAGTARGLLMLVVRAGGGDLGRVHISHQTVKDSSHPDPGQERARVAGERGMRGASSVSLGPFQQPM